MAHTQSAAIGAGAVGNPNSCGSARNKTLLHTVRKRRHLLFRRHLAVHDDLAFPHVDRPALSSVIAALPLDAVKQ